MRLERVLLNGYKRLTSASFYVNRRLVALVGPNEAGKSSVLEALQSLGSNDPIPPSAQSRSLTALTDQSTLVTAVYRLGKADADLLADLPIVRPPSTMTRSKRIDGTIDTVFDPAPKFVASLLTDAGRALPAIESALERLRGRLAVQEEVLGGPTRDLVEAMIDSLAGKNQKFFNDSTFSGQEWRDIWAVRQEWIDLNQLRGVKPAWSALERYYDLVETPEPLGERVLASLSVALPRFLTFSADDRALTNEYDVAAYDPTEGVPGALASLLEFAELDLVRLQRIAPDEPLVETEISQANVRMAAKFEERWKQSKVSVYLKMDRTILKIFIEDTDLGTKAFFSERSDGLRTFVGLMLFLERQGADRQTVLLIDEADMHLHLDAQADLVRMLATFEGVAQVIYTTHSPGCLPPDLGTGVRFVVRDTTDPTASVIAPFYWSAKATGAGSGFMPMLFMMGAGSAAFSRLRFALIVEGQTEAILLPTLLRAATEAAELPYQVVPGLSQVSGDDFHDLSSVAVNVSYLVDGDEGGRELMSKLESRKIAQSRRFQLPDGFALEDLIDPALYVSTVNKFLGAKRFDVETLKEGTAKHQIEKWAARNKVKLPGAVVVAECILTDLEAGEIDLKLSIGAKPFLRALDRKLRSSFSLESAVAK